MKTQIFSIIGKMNLITKSIALFVFVLSNSIAYGQTYPLLSTYEGDTVLIFNIEQGRYLTKSNEEKKYYKNLVELCEREIVVQKEITNNQDSVITNFNLVKNDYEIIIRNKDDLLGICEMEKETLVTEIKKQKRHKIIAIIGGSIISLLGLLIAI